MLRPYYIQRPAPQNLQAYFPSLEVLFPSIQHHNKGSPTLAAAELILDLSGTTATVENLVTKEISTKDNVVFTFSIKYTRLLLFYNSVFVKLG
jgi:hypothetical protein